MSEARRDVSLLLAVILTALLAPQRRVRRGCWSVRGFPCTQVIGRHVDSSRSLCAKPVRACWVKWARTAVLEHDRCCVVRSLGQEVGQGFCGVALVDVRQWTGRRPGRALCPVGVVWPD
ncbi:MAG: hypothetical protein ACRDQ9_15760 [Pseudonocardiaceae bacterium]